MDSEPKSASPKRNVFLRFPVLRFFSSVKLAVPLMIALATVVAIGTLYESRYNAQIAGLHVYRSTWFLALLGLLWLNIFCATLSRLPFRKHHTGFVITHIGLLTLLVGSMMTAILGVDGNLRIVVGKKERTVYTPDLVLRVWPEKDGQVSGPPALHIPVARRLESAGSSELGFEDFSRTTGVLIDRYLPFVRATGGGSAPMSAGGGTAVAFGLQSNFFNVNETLDSAGKSAMQLGPAQLRLVVGGGKAKAKGKSKPKSTVAVAQAAGKTSGGAVELWVKKGTELQKKISLKGAEGKSFSIGESKVEIVRLFKNGVVDKGKLAERGDGEGSNPAVEFFVTVGGQKVRDITFGKFLGFTIQKTPVGDLHFELHTPEGAAPEAATAESGESSAPSGGPVAATGMGNEIVFNVVPGDSKRLTVFLFKGGKVVLEKAASVGETVVTPWMGMKITVTSISSGAGGAAGDMASAPSSGPQVEPIDLIPKTSLPPSALHARLFDQPGDDGFWLVENSEQSIRTSRGNFRVYYGMNNLDLPFEVQLESFAKKDYPGTETAMSFESVIRLNGTGEPILVKMNEPMSHQGFVLYQSSYEMGQGMETASIFSVNQDPGRWVKYIGAIVLCAGIVIFTLMRSRWYLDRERAKKKELVMLQRKTFGILFGAVLSLAAAHSGFAADLKGLNMAPEAVEARFKEAAGKIDVDSVRTLAVQSHGRVKPFDTFAREVILFVAGKYRIFGLDPIQTYLQLILGEEESRYIEIVNIRDPELREKLGFSKKDRYLSLYQIENSPLEKISQPILEKQRQNDRSVSPDEKKILEALQQAFLVREVIGGGNLMQAINLDVEHPSDASHMEGSPMVNKLRAYLSALASGNSAMARERALDMREMAIIQPMPELFRPYLKAVKIEVFYNHFNPFFWSALFYFLLAVALLSKLGTTWLSTKRTLLVAAVPLFFHVLGFVLRIYITGFAPVTSMYGTMIWMALGVVVFGSVLFKLYQNRLLYGILLVGASATLFLSEGIPLILSPDMDPVVAVLRNNFWLTIHVLTVSISYAAFTIAMLVGNTANIRILLKGEDDKAQMKSMAHVCYRSVQLGVFLLTLGIILGGWWADYSWGRFWGWDPKETWALIADLGFLAILHARFIGWLGDFGLLAAAPIAYLLVIMAWYGVNFILAAGLHSYGFSSGGATIVATFVGVQVVISVLAWARKWRSSAKVSAKA